MQYDRYEQKIQKIENFLKLVFKHMAKIVTVLALITVATVTLLATRGIVTGGDAPEGEIFYGDTLPYKANAFLSKVEYQYSPVGKDEWSEDFPLTPGEYQVRGVAKATIGYRYGEAESFTIQKKPVTVRVVSGPVLYGSTPEVVAELVQGDRISDRTLVYSEDRKTVSVENVKISDADGNDVTERYEISTESGNITTQKRPITLDFVSRHKVYDGKELRGQQWNIIDGSLAYGDEVADVVFLNAITNVGSAQIEMQYKITDRSGRDVTEYYEITEKIGVLSIDPRPLTVTTGAQVWTYDGSSHFNEEKTFDGLAEGHSFNITDGFPRLTDAGSEVNRITYDIMCGAEMVDKSNYVITEAFGTLTVNKRDITVKTGDGEWEYNGQEQSNTYIDRPEGLLDGHRIEIIEGSVFKITNVWQTAKGNNVIKVNVLDGTEPVTRNYNIKYDYGTLTVKKHVVTVTTNPYEATYDGHDHTDEVDFDIEGIVVPFSYTVLKKTPIKDVIRDGDNKVISVDNEITVKVLCNGVEVDPRNCEIKENYGKITIRPIEITVKTADQDWTYDGTEHYNSYIERPAGLITTHRITAVGELFKITNVSQTADGNNKFEFDIVDENERSVKSNYDIECKYGTLTVTPRPVTVTTQSESWIYDGREHSNSDVLASGLAYGHEVKASGSVIKITNVWETQPNLFAVAIYDGDGEPVTDNYTIYYIYGTLSVTPRTVTVTTGDYYDKAYNGYDHRYEDGVKVNVSGLDGTALVYKVISETDIQNVKRDSSGSVIECDNIVEIEVLCNGERVDTRNCEIIGDYGKVKILPVKVTVTTGSADKVYDGSPLTSTKWSVVGSSGEEIGEDQCLVLASHYFYWATSTGSQTEVGNSPNTYSGTVMVKEKNFDTTGDTDVTVNYDIEVLCGTLEVRKRQIRIESESYDIIYDGKTHKYDIFVYDDGKEGEKVDFSSGDSGYYKLFDGHILKVWDRLPQYDAFDDERENLFEFKIFKEGDEREEDITDRYYDINTVFGTAKIAKRPIYISSADIDITYDGTEHFSGEASYTGEGENEGLLTSLGHTVIYKGELPRFINATGRYGLDGELIPLDASGEFPKNYVTFVIMDGLDEVTSNYEIVGGITPGDVIIRPRPITVTTPTHDRVYDGKTFSDGTVSCTPYGEDEGLCIGHQIKEGEPKTFKDVVYGADGKTVIGVLNDTPFEIMCSGEEISKSNYVITYEYGSVKITPRPIYITAGDIILTYDGEEHFNIEPKDYTREAEEMGLLESLGHYLRPTNKPLFTNAVFTENNVTFVIECDGVDVTANYEIVGGVTPGTVNISRRPITVTTGDYYDKIYDGLDHRNDLGVGATVSGLEGTELTFDIAESTEIKNVLRDVDGNAGEFENKVTVSILYKGAVVDESNYVITPYFGKVMIKPRPITLSTEGIEKEYDGKTFSDGTISYTPNGLDKGICVGHNVEWGEPTAFKDVTYGDDGKTVVFVKNNVSYKFMCDDEEISKDNYLVDEQFGEVKILPRKVTVTTGDYYDMLYDGRDHKDDDGVRVNVVGLDGTILTYEIAESTEIKNVLRNQNQAVTDGENKVTVKFLCNGADDKESNYEVTTTYGRVKILPREIYVSVSGYSGVYDGKEHSRETTLSADTERGSALCNDHSFKITEYKTEIKNVVSNVDNIVEFTVVDGNGASVIGNYDIKDVEYGTVNITKRPVTVKTNDIDLYYDGEYHSDETPFADETDGGLPLCNGHTFKVLTHEEFKAVIENGENRITYIILDENENDVTRNYLPTDKFGTVNIKLVIVEITIKDLNKEFDGLPLVVTDQYIGNDYMNTLISKGFEFKITFKGSQTHVGTSESDVESVVIFDRDGNDVSEMFDYRVEKGSLTVTQSTVKIHLHKMIYEYDAVEHSYTLDNWNTVSIPGGLEFIMKAINISMTNAGVITSAQIAGAPSEYLEYEILMKESGEAALDGDIIMVIVDSDGNEEYDVLTITQRLLELTTGSASKPYDGTALTYDYFYVSNGLVAEGHDVHIDIVGSQTNVNTDAKEEDKRNTADISSFRVTYIDSETGDVIDVTANYTIISGYSGTDDPEPIYNISYGKLEVF